MSISDDIGSRIRALAGTQLHHLPPLLESEPQVRQMIVSTEVLSAVTPPWPENFDGERLAAFRATLDAFTAGYVRAVAEDPFGKPPYADIARVHPVGDEIWDIRAIDPRARVRCLGAFGGRDRFVALTWDYRENLVGAWREEIDRCKAEWSRLFGKLPRFKGAMLDDYLSDYYAV
jgi:hypothetical protein